MFPPYSSAHYGHDSACIDELIEVHCDAQDPVILDCTYNRGVFWSRSRFQPSVRSDLAQHIGIDLRADCTALPFRAETFDVIVFDPPYIPDHSRVKTFWERSFSTVKKHHHFKLSVNPLLSAFLREAKRVLVPGGIALVKIGDIVMSGHYQWQHVHLINAAEVLGMTPCDLKIKLTPSAGYMKPPQWKTIQHFQKVHTYWIVIRNSNRCSRRNPMARPKPAQDRQLALL